MSQDMPEIRVLHEEQVNLHDSSQAFVRSIGLAFKADLFNQLPVHVPTWNEKTLEMIRKDYSSLPPPSTTISSRFYKFRRSLPRLRDIGINSSIST